MFSRFEGLVNESDVIMNDSDVTVICSLLIREYLNCLERLLVEMDMLNCLKRTRSP